MGQNLIDLEIALQDYNDSIDQVLVSGTKPADLDEMDNMAWTANYLPVQPERRRTLANISGNSRIMALAWLFQAALYSILIIGML